MAFQSRLLRISSQLQGEKTFKYPHRESKKQIVPRHPGVTRLTARPTGFRRVVLILARAPQNKRWLRKQERGDKCLTNVISDTVISVLGLKCERLKDSGDWWEDGRGCDDRKRPESERISQICPKIRYNNDFTIAASEFYTNFNATIIHLFCDLLQKFLPHTAMNASGSL